MSLPASTLATYAAIGNREDLSDVIYNVDPTETPIFSAVEKGKASAINHEWQTQALAAMDTDNAVLEGDDATTDAATPTVRLGNICQISDKVGRVTGSQQAVEHAGRDNELEYQQVLKGKELRIDMEGILFGTNQAKNAGADATKRRVASILSWIGTNDVFNSAASGASPVALLGASTRTDGTQRAFTEAHLKECFRLIWASGGKPNNVYLGGFNKQVMSTFTGRATPTEDTKAKKIVASVDAYESDFGTVKVVASRNMRSRDCLVLQTDMWKICHLNGRKMVSIPLARTGDSERFQMLSEYTLEACNEKSSGGVFDLTTS
jgi:hypothetical protein